jgi:hypothetical protein
MALLSGGEYMAIRNKEAPLKTIEVILSSIIDDWYEKVSGYYVTAEQLREDPDLQKEEELKRFHDEKGHRIKFSKDDLDFTYGLRSSWENNHIIIEVSVNNKVDNFDYDGFEARLMAHYEKTGDEKVTSPYELRNQVYRDVFQFEPNLREAFKVEKREDKADIMRLSFHVNNALLEKIVSHPQASKQLVETYCVTPFRSVYATVYRRSR